MHLPAMTRVVGSFLGKGHRPRPRPPNRAENRTAWSSTEHSSLSSSEGCCGEEYIVAVAPRIESKVATGGGGESETLSCSRAPLRAMHCLGRGRASQDEALLQVPL